MPQHNPEDRVRVKNIVAPDGDDFQIFWITRYQKVPTVDANGMPGTRDVPFEKEIEWNFAKGFFFIWGGEPFVLKRGEDKAYPRWLADHCVNHMVSHVLTRRYQASKKLGTDGTPLYDNNILNNETLKKKLRAEIVMGVDEWATEGNDTFDKMIADQFGGDFDGLTTDIEDKSDKDFELPEVPQDEPVREVTREEIPPTSDLELQKIREEADINGVTYGAKDTTQAIKAKIIKEMA